MTIKEIDEKIKELQKEKRKIEDAEIADFLTLAKTNIGRCFFEKETKRCFKIINIPQKKYYRLGVEFNMHQYPAIILDADGFIPVSEGYFFLKYTDETKLFEFHPDFTEITEKDFNELFINRINGFCNRIINNEVNTE